MPDLAAIAETFSRFAVAEARENLSPLYERLSLVVAEDGDLLALSAETREGQPKPNMLFAAVQYLLADRREDPLAAWYPAFAGGGEPKGDLAGAFRTFLLGHRDEVAALLSTRMVQTNEVRRSALLLPAFAGVLASSGKPLALIEIGPSAGLNLLFDLYHYRYRSFELGDPRSPVRRDRAAAASAVVWDPVGGVARGYRPEPARRGEPRRHALAPGACLARARRPAGVARCRGLGRTGPSAAGARRRPVRAPSR